MEILESIQREILLDPPDMPVMVRPCTLADLRAAFGEWIEEIRRQIVPP